MQLKNQKTGVIFSSQTKKENGLFLAIAMRKETDTESVVYSESCKTRAASRYRAEREAFRAYMAHVRIFSM